ncbi:MAG: GH39 family glycosyl hydrolase [Anaerolineae bacterium]
MEITIDCTQSRDPLNHFWRSTGFTPANLLLDADMQQAMAYVGAIPRGGITYVRIHYLLELVLAEGLGTDAPVYDWSRLDAALDVLVRNGLKPIFELMGNVGGYFNDYTDPVQAHAWKRLVRDLALHLIDRCGQDEVRGWLFETWNEPDVHFWRQSIEAFCIYYDACVQGLREADPALTIGGPGTCRNLSEMLTAFLAHCVTGINDFTGETGVRLDFISVHEKGVRSHKEDLTPNSMGIVEREARIVDYIREHHPRFSALPFFNDECDPQVGWGDIHTWRARPYYAAFVCKVINQHLVKLADEMGVHYGLLSNDNGFLGTWGHRTLFARFAEFDHIDHGQADGKRDAPRFEEDARRRKFELIKKPVFTVMTLLSLLGETRLAVEGVGDVAEDVGVIATRHGDDQIAVLIYNSHDKIPASSVTPVTLRLTGLPFDTAMLAHYRIDEAHGDPFSVWESYGAPTFPTPEQYAKMRAAQEIALLKEPREVSAEDGALTLAFDLPLPGVSLVLLSARPVDPPGKVTGLHAERYEGMTGEEEILLIWNALDSRTVRTYKVLHAPTPEGPFTRINEPDQLDAAFLHVAESVYGCYRVRAVDYWGRVGTASEVLIV